MREAKTHLSRLVQVIALNDPHQSDRCVRRLGLLQGQCSVPDDFDQMEADALADLFEGLGSTGP